MSALFERALNFFIGRDDSDRLYKLNPLGEQHRLYILMMQVTDTDWSKTEQIVAKAAFDKAYQREVAALMQQVRAGASEIASLEDLWQLHDFLSARRHELDGKYDYRYSVLIFVFSRLIREGWLHVDELAGLAPDKLTKITVLATME